MISALSDWLKHLVVLILLAVFLDMVLPNTSMQRYVRTVLGLVVMLAMLAPLRALISTHLNLGLLESQLSGPIVNTSQSISQAQASVQTFRTDLATTLANEVRQTLGVSLVQVNVQITVKADGTPIVTGVLATISTVGVTHKTQVVNDVKAQIAALLGLQPASVTISYPGMQA